MFYCLIVSFFYVLAAGLGVVLKPKLKPNFPCWHMFQITVNTNN